MWNIGQFGGWLIDLIQHYSGLGRELIVRLLWTAGIVVGYLLARMVLGRLVARRSADPTRRYVARKATAYLVGLAAAIAVIHIWMGGLAGLATYFGLLSAGVLLALSGPLASVAAWLYIITRKPFTVGDRIQIGPHVGDVVDIGMFRFSIVEVGNWVRADQSTGRVIHVPNGWVFTQATANYTQGFNFIWTEIPLTVSYASNWPAAKQLLLDIGTRHAAHLSAGAAGQLRLAADRFLIHFEHLTPIVWTSAGDAGITLTLRYLCEPRMRRTSEAAIWEELLRVLPQHHDIELAAAKGKLFSPADAQDDKTGRAEGPRANGE